MKFLIPDLKNSVLVFGILLDNIYIVNIETT